MVKDTLYFTHFSKCRELWPWTNFSPKEVACKHCGEMVLDRDAMDALQTLREDWGKPIVLTSAHRCTTHNRKVGGTEGSQHLHIAFDCACPASDQAAFVEFARQAGFTGIGRYPKRGFVHLDCGPKREWKD